MKTLIVYYTRTGTTRIAAEAIKNALGDEAHLDEIKDKKDRQGIKGYLISGREAAKQALADIEEHKYDPAKYDLVVIGTPVWVGLCAPAIRTYIEHHKQYFKKVALFSTQGGDKTQRVFADLKEQLGREAVAEEYFATKTVRQNKFQGKLKNFVDKINK